MSRTTVLGLGLLGLSMLAGCVSVPRSNRDDADAALSAAWPDEAAFDGGTGRPPTGEPYLGPECDPAQPSGPGGPSSVAGDAGAGLDAGPASASSELPGQGSGPMAHASDPDQPHSARHPLEGEIAITEIMSNPAAVADTAGEWFELRNESAEEALDLGGCSIDDGSAKPHAVPTPFVIAKGEYVVVGRGAEAGFVPDLVLSFSLGNTADTLVLRCDGREIDRVAYDASFPLVAGASMSLDPAADARDNDAASAWCAAQAAYAGDLGSPGAANPACDDTGEADAGVD